MKQLNQPLPSRQSGMSLIEIMVAVVVVSVGLLGVARMEIFAKQSNVEAVQRTAATQLAQQIITKMRANPSQLSAYEGQVLGAGKLAAPTSCENATCTTAQIAAWDLYQWEQSLMGTNEIATITNSNAGGLDTPRGCIAGPAGGGVGQYTVSISWRGKTPLTNPGNGCGAGLGLYGNNDEYRRVLTITMYISNTGA